jgi:hypothetical protein
VTSLHDHGDYALRISYECQAANPYDLFTLGSTSPNSITSTSATITIHVSSAADRSDMRYRVDYGTAYADYSSTSPWLQASLGKGQEHVDAVVTGLAPDTTYHYRIEAYNDTTGIVRYGGSSFSGVERTRPSAPFHDVVEVVRLQVIGRSTARAVFHCGVKGYDNVTRKRGRVNRSRAFIRRGVPSARRLLPGPDPKWRTDHEHVPADCRVCVSLRLRGQLPDRT